MSRAEKVKRAQELRARGLLNREIAAEMGVVTSTVNAWLNDPDLARQRARRERYAKRCDRCGGPTDGSRGYKHQTAVCQKCREWNDDAIIAAIKGGRTSTVFLRLVQTGGRLGWTTQHTGSSSNASAGITLYALPGLRCAVTGLLSVRSGSRTRFAVVARWPTSPPRWECLLRRSPIDFVIEG